MSAGHWRDLTFAVWGGLAAVLVAMLLLARARHAGRRVLSPALRNRVVRAVALLGWAWLGWHLFAR